MHKVWPDSLKINMRFNFPLFLQINWATPLSILWGRILQISSLKLWRHYEWWWLFFWKFWQFLPQGLPKNAWMVMKLCENLKPRKIHIIYDNEHYCNKWLFRKATKITFFSALFKKSQFSLKIYPLKITSQKISNSKFSIFKRAKKP